jgi:hypothetical protein
MRNWVLEIMNATFIYCSRKSKQSWLEVFDIRTKQECSFSISCGKGTVPQAYSGTTSNA